MTGNIRLEVLEPVSNVVATVSNTDLEEFKDSVRLSCSSSGSSPSFLWLNSSSEVTASDRVQLTDGNSTLTIVNVTRNDQGPFICNVSNSVSSASSEPILLSIYERVSTPVITVNNTDLVEFNSSVRLSCSSSGSSLSFLWLNSSSEVTASDRVQLTDGNSNLTIVNVTRYDQGPFICHVSNPVSNGTSGPVNLSISYGPENINLTKYPLKEYFEEGSNITLSCSAVSRPSALLYWFLNADKLSVTGPELILVNIQINYSGNYSCQAFNNKTLRYETSQPSLVSVLERISGASVTSSSTQPIEEMPVNLTCEAAGSVVNRKWKKGDSSVLPDHIKFYDNNRVLSFQPLKRTDDGEYSCEISNPVSSNTTKYIMTVNYGPEKVQIEGPSEIRLNQTLTLICSAESTPAANYTWTLNGTEIHKSAVFTKVITKLSDSGKYTCEARNIITEKTSSAEHGLTVTAMPEKTALVCSPGCIAGIVIACLVVCGAAAGGGGYYIYRKKKMAKTPIDRNTATITGRAGQDNTAYSGNQDVNYADIRFFQNKEGGRVQVGTQNDMSSQYAEVRMNSGRAAGSSPPTYNAYMQQSKRLAPQPTGTQVYAQVRKN
ncbi:carcinoembryonic antigen-related cell adhesion molecule 5 isoform X1 [Larimichthys crocea]|uniref:carcinoembryonic antigen-related cell adhesion molecule 5 isoform X1 n=1 Tax=Larimichthys crocea TaxID=215358 RepID=UPI000F5FC6B0|nr:carcinoembryonic antigen-related cell adhesion molecule 5 isoform X1 [Larimichthys crocea]